MVDYAKIKSIKSKLLLYIFLEMNPKKCRARYGLDRQEQWCKPCRYEPFDWFLHAFNLFKLWVQCSIGWFCKCKYGTSTLQKRL